MPRPEQQSRIQMFIAAPAVPLGTSGMSSSRRPESIWSHHPQLGTWAHRMRLAAFLWEKVQ